MSNLKSSFQKVAKDNKILTPGSITFICDGEIIKYI